MEYPPFGYRYAYEPVFCRRLYRNRISPFESYVTNVQRQLESILYDGLFDLVEHHARQEPEQQEQQEKHESEPKQEEAREKEEKQEEDQEAPQSQSFFFSSSVTLSRDGRGRSELVEEHRERVMGRDGSVHTVTRRQIGDRWYVHESHSTKDGESSSKETWHNVPEEAIESFKQEWEDRHSLKHEQPQEPQEPQQALPEDSKTEE